MYHFSGQAIAFVSPHTPFQPAEKENIRILCTLPVSGKVLFYYKLGGSPTGKYQKNIENARSVTIMQYLTTCHPGELVRKTDDEYCTKTHSSLVITPSKDLFHWFSQNIDGRSALDYMTNVERVDFVSAVRFLNELTPVPVSSQMAKTAASAKQQKPREFELPKADKNCEAVTA